MSTETDAMLTCAVCEEVNKPSKFIECAECGDTICLLNDCSIADMDKEVIVCNHCVDEAWEFKREKRGSWSNE